MRKLYSLSTLVLAILFSSISYSQEGFSNKGKEFWISYPEHIDATASVMGLYLTSDVNTSGTVNDNGTVIPFTITANTITTVFLGSSGPVQGPNSFIHMGGIQDGIKIRGAVQILAAKPIVVYSHIIRTARSGATLVLPTNVWGKEYIVPSFANFGSSGANAGIGEINIMAALAGTVVEITPSITTRNGMRPAGVPYQITLASPGDVYQVQFPQNSDLSGTTIKSLSATGGSGCPPIAVISATTWTGLNCAGSSGGDNFYQQLFPTGAWGKHFITTPLKKRQTNPGDFNVDIVRVYVKTPGTVVTKTDNGSTVVLSTLITPGNYYQYTAYNPTDIQADNPVQVMQYITSQSCTTPNIQSDPEMIALSAVEQTINDITVYSSIAGNVPNGNSNINVHFINVTMKSANTGSFTINGNPPTVGWIPITGTSYSFIKQPISPAAPTSRLKADSGFNAIAYGFGETESYGYNAGTNVKDLYQQVALVSDYGIETTPSICAGADFKFKISLPYCAESIQWDLSSTPLVSPPLQVYTTCAVVTGGPDSTTTVNGIPLYWYSLPGIYNVATAGSYPVSIFVFKSTPDDCGNLQEINFDLNVYDPPLTDFTFTNPNCPAEVVQFTETTSQVPRPTYRFWWSFGDPASGAANNSTVRNPTHTFSAPGLYTVRFVGITTSGCKSDTIEHQVDVPGLPIGTIAAPASVCVNGTANITFSGGSGTAPYTFFYNINGGPALSVNSIGLNATVPANTTVAGTFTYTLDSVRNQGSPLCVQHITGQSTTITVNPLPTATIAGNIAVCRNAAAPTITFTGAGSTSPYTFTYNINGGPSQTVVSVGNTATVTAPTGTPGTFTYNLVSVQDASVTTCSQAQAGSAVVTVNPLPTATISGTATVCRNAASPNVTFTGANGTAPYTFTYNINGGPSQTVVSAGPSATVPASTATSGTFVYNLVSVQDASVSTCSQAQTGSVTITVNAPPTATISGTASVCQNGTGPIITFTGAGSVTPYTFTYNINGGPSQTVVSAGPSVTVTAPTGTPGTFVYNLVSIADGSPAACGQAQTGSATITVNPSPTATISGTVAVCRNAASPNITFTGVLGTAPFTFTYTINGGAPQTVISAGPSATVAAPTGTVGTFIYALVSVQDASPNLCSQSQTGTATVTVNPLPTATISGTATVCRNAGSPNVTFTGAGGTAPYTFTYNINGGPAQTVVSAGPSATVAAPTGTAGTFVYNLVSVQDASSTACNQLQPGSTTITVNPLPTATVAGTVAVCQNAAAPTITFTGAGSTSPYTFTYNINGGPSQTVVSVGNTATVTAPTGTPGTFTYNLVSVQDASVTTCSQAQAGSAVVTVNPLPTATISGTATVCRNVASPNVTFTGANGTAPYTFTYNINGGPSQTVVSAGPSATVPASTVTSGTFVYNLVSVQDASVSTCSQAQTGSVTITVNAPPTATISGTASVCQNGTGPIITFTGAGSVTPYTFTYNINGGPSQTVVSAGPSVTVTAPTGTPGTFVYNLVSIADGSPAACGQAQTGSATITVNPSPTATISGTVAVCRNAASPNITFTGVLGTAPFTFTYTINGGAPQTVISAGPSATVAAPTGTVGTFIYALVSVQDASPNLCSQSQTGTATVTVNPLPTATISGTATVCRNAGSPNVTFTGAGGTAPYTFTYNINGGPAQTVVSAGPSATVAAPTGTAGTFVYNLVSVQDASSTACNQLQPGSTTITVNPLPTATVAGTVAVCQNAAAPTITFTGASTTAPYTFTYNINGGPSQTVVSVGNTATVTAPTGTPGTFTYNLVSVQDASATTCSQAQAGSAVVTVNPNHAITLSSAASTTNQTVCINTPITQISYTLSGGATGVTVSGLPAGVTHTVTGNTVTINGTPTVSGTAPYTITTTGNGCATASLSGSIDVTPAQALNLSSAPGTNTQSVCINTALTNIIYTLSGGATAATVSGLPAGITSSLSGATLTISGTPTTVGSAIPYTITSSGNTCTPATVSGTITVTPDHVITLSSAASTTSQTVCSDRAMTPITYTLSGGATGANFSAPLPPGVSSSLSGNTLTISGSPTTVGNYNYSITTTGNSCVTASASGSINVIQTPAVQFDPVAGICADVPAFTVSGLPAGGTFSGTGVTAAGLFRPSVAGAGDHIVRYTFTAANGCSNYQEQTISVYPLPKVDAGPDRGIIEGGQITLTPLITANFPVTYSWSPAQYLSNPNIANPVVAGIPDDKTYTLTVTSDKGCSASDFLLVKLLRRIEIPNIFSPNKDGIHDTWMIQYLDSYPGCTVEIFNRYGQRIYQSEGYAKPWDGTINGNPVPVGTYYYIINPKNGRSQMSGYVDIIR